MAIRFSVSTVDLRDTLNPRASNLETGCGAGGAPAVNTLPDGLNVAAFCFGGGSPNHVQDNRRTAEVGHGFVWRWRHRLRLRLMSRQQTSVPPSRGIIHVWFQPFANE